MVPLGAFVNLRAPPAPTGCCATTSIPRAEIQGDAAPGNSSGQAIAAMEAAAPKALPTGFGYEWTDLALQQKQAGSSGGSSSPWRWCSSSWCWRRSTRA